MALSFKGVWSVSEIIVRAPGWMETSSSSDADF